MSLYPEGQSHSYPILRSLQMWEQPPLLSAHSFRPAERVGGRTEVGTGTRVKGSKEKFNIDEITPAGYWTEQFSLDKTKIR